MCALALSGIVGYSVRPLYISIVLGLVSICLAMAYFLYVLVVTCCGITTISLGWPSLIATVLAIGGVQLFILGILGIYMGKLYMENKERPTYVIGDKTK
jgi:dolichol-phosphate mannosyltransferase